MHNSDVVLTISTENNSLTEHNFKKDNDSKSCEVYIPFDSEYAINVKNNKSVRIDGSLVTGEGIVIPAKCNRKIERYLDTPKKFKFVKASHDAVSDPTNPFNGKVEIIVSEEKSNLSVQVAELTKKMQELEKHNSWPVYTPPPQYPGVFPSTYYPPIQYSPATYHYCNNQNIGSFGINILNTSAAIGAIADSSLGATVEGGLSTQLFESTNWGGSESNKYSFTFQLKGKTATVDTEYQEYLRLQAKFGK